MNQKQDVMLQEMTLKGQNVLEKPVVQTNYQIFPYRTKKANCPVYKMKNVSFDITIDLNIFMNSPYNGSFDVTATDKLINMLII